MINMLWAEWIKHREERIGNINTEIKILRKNNKNIARDQNHCNGNEESL